MAEAVNYRDGRIFTAYSLPPGLDGTIEQQAHVWLNNALFLDNDLDTKQYFCLADTKSIWPLAFDPSEDEFAAVQAIVSYWQPNVRPRYSPSPVDVIGPTTYAALYENILGLRVWLKDNIGLIGWYSRLPDNKKNLSFIAARIYLRTMDYWIRAIVTKDMSALYNGSSIHPIRYFRFHDTCKRCRMLIPGTGRRTYRDFLCSYQVEITNKAFGEYLSDEVSYYKSSLLNWMEDLPTIIVRAPRGRNQHRSECGSRSEAHPPP